MYVGGNFTTVLGSGGTPLSAQYIARWDGESWHAVGSGLSSIGYAVTAYRGSIFVGGNFSVAGNKPSSGIARWDSVPVPVEISDFRGASSNGIVTLRWSLTRNRPHSLARLCVFARRRECETKLNNEL